MALLVYTDLGIDGFTHPHSHVKGDNSDADVLRGLPVDIGQLQPGVVLLLPCLQGVSGCEWRRYKKRDKTYVHVKSAIVLSGDVETGGQNFTFSRVVQEEALEQLVLNGKLLCRVIWQDVFMAHVIQT